MWTLNLISFHFYYGILFNRFKSIKGNRNGENFDKVTEIKKTSVILGNKNKFTYLSGGITPSGNSITHRCLKIPSHNCTPTIPNMKNTKKQSNKTFPNIGNVSNNNITRILIPGIPFIS